MVKIIDLLSNKKVLDEKFVSYEYFPPKTPKGVENLYKVMERMKATDPLFIDVTWGAGGSTAELTLDIVKAAKQQFGLEANMHLTCTNMSSTLVTTALDEAKAAGIQNILALRGDPPAGQEEWEKTEGGFSCALDLVKFIRKVHGDYFGISVAGYPDGHPNKILPVDNVNKLSESELSRLITTDGEYFVCSDEDYALELKYLKAKVDAGADFIITQMFFEAESYVNFVKECRNVGIDCPILPGLMCIQAYGGFDRMTKCCKSRVPIELRDSMELVKDSPNEVKEFGISYGTKLCLSLLQSGAPGIHFYTLNHDSIVNGILPHLPSRV